jgi:ProP effector
MSRNAIVGVISLLAEKWPCCFSIPYSQRRPLKLGIREDVLAALDGAIPASKVSAALRWYVSSREYQRRMVHGAWRVDLNGMPAGTVSEEDEAHARALLFAIQPKPPERARASSNSEPQRVEQTLQTEQRKCATRATFAGQADDVFRARKVPLDHGSACKADGRPSRAAAEKKRGQIRAWRAP